MNEKTYRQGLFHPRNPEKYLGDITRIVYRSSWELKMFKDLDNNLNILKWTSEPFGILYTKPVPVTEDARGWREAKYFPDLFVVYKDRNNNIIKEVIEIKPLKQLSPSKARNPNTKLQENYTYQINCLKWRFAKEWCDKRGLNFRLCTEKQLFRK